MKRAHWLGGMAWMLAVTASVAEVSPPDTALPDDKVTTIACEFPASQTAKSATPTTAVALATRMKTTSKSGKDAEIPSSLKQDASRTYKGTYHYRVYVPSDYSQSKDQRYPCLFIASPGGNAGLDNLAARAKRDRWIAVMLVESKNGYDPWLANFLAAHDDATQRLRIDTTMLFSTGFSGGARAASVYGACRPGFRGLILQGAGYSQEKDASYIFDANRRAKQFLVYAIFGKEDSNAHEIDRLRPGWSGGTRWIVEMFAGGHQPAPVEQMEHAMDWLDTWLLSATVAPALSPDACAWFRDNKLAQWKGASDSKAKYELIQQILALSQLPTMRTDAVLKAQLPEVQAALAELLKDAEISKLASKRLPPESRRIIGRR